MSRSLWSRAALLFLASNRHGANIDAVARHRGFSPEVVALTKAAVDAETAVDLLDGGYQAERLLLIGELKSACAVLAAYNRGLFTFLPFYTPFGAAGAGVRAGMRGEGRPLAGSHMSLVRGILEPSSVGGILAMSNSFIDTGGQAAVDFMERLLLAVLGEAIDEFFVSALIDSSTPNQPASGTTPAAALADLRFMLGSVFKGQRGFNGFWIVGSSALVALSTLGAGAAVAAPLLFPGLGVAGGDLLGLPAFCSTGIADDSIVLVDGSQVGMGFENVSFGASTSAAFEMSDTPAQDATAGTGVSMVSMFAADSAALRVTARVGFDKFRESGFAEITGANYSTPSA